MISADLRFEGFDVRSWTHLISLFSPGLVERLDADPIGSDAPEANPGDGEARCGSILVVVDDRSVVLKAFHSSRGRVKGLRGDEISDLPGLARKYGARRAVVLRAGVMEEITERLAMRLSRGDDYVGQCLTVSKIVREMQEAGLLHVWPRPLANVPIPSVGTIRRALDVLIPDDRAMLAVLWEGERPWTSVALRRRNGSIDLVAGPDLIARWTGPLGGDWRRDHRVVVRAVSHAVAPVHVGIFSQVSTMRRLLSHAEPGAWARAAAVRDVLIYPAPAYAAVALSADALRGVARLTARTLGSFDFVQALGPIAQLLRSRVAQVGSVTETLGFDPLAALAAVLRREDHSGDDPESGDPPVDGELGTDRT